jgi:hypothetical protein
MATMVDQSPHGLKPPAQGVARISEGLARERPFEQRA